MRNEAKRRSPHLTNAAIDANAPSFDPFERRKLKAVAPTTTTTMSSTTKPSVEVFDAFNILNKPETDRDAILYNNNHNGFPETTKSCLPKPFSRSFSHNNNNINDTNRRRRSRTPSRLLCRSRRPSPEAPKQRNSTPSRGRRRDRTTPLRNKLDIFARLDTANDDYDDDGDNYDDNDIASEKNDKLTRLLAAREPLTLSTQLPLIDPIPIAVQTLDIDDYPAAAEQRATQILRHWILDKGLFDELANYHSTSSGINNNYKYNNDSFDELLSVPSIKSQEGVEVGAHGFPIEGLQRLDQEMDILADRIKSELTLVNAQLNISNDKDNADDSHQLATLLQQYEEHPRIQTLFNSRENIHTVLEQLDTFYNLPQICDGLYRDINDDPVALNALCKKHNDLQVMLVGIEADFKARMDETATRVQTSGVGANSKSTRHRNPNKHRFVPTYPNHGGVNEFLAQPSKLVWDLGYRLHHQLMERIKVIHRLRPHEITALTEAVELYERAAEQQSHERPNSDDRRRHTKLKMEPLRQVALYTIVEAFELRCYQVIQTLHEEAADDAQSQDGEMRQFNAIHEAMTLLYDQVESIDTLVQPHVPGPWHVTALWMMCVATVSSQFILQQIGGQQGNNLDLMAVTQLLDLLSWIEHFRNKANEMFPDILRDTITKTKFVCVAELLDDKDITEATIKECLISVLHVLWDIHRLAHDQFMVRTQFQTHEWLENVYRAEHQYAQTADGRLITSLPEDLWALSRVQLETISERLPEDSAVLVDAASIVFYQMQLKQRRSRDWFLVDLESCCANANDLLRMVDQAAQLLTVFQQTSGLPPDSMATLETITDELICQYSADAVISAQAVHEFVFETLEEELVDRLFQFEWEDKTHNEMAMTIVRTIEDFFTDIEEWLDPSMVRKSMDGLVKGCVNFYIRHMILRAAKQPKVSVTSCFQSNERALQRMAGDIKVMRDFFDGYVESLPALGPIIKIEFALLENVFCLVAIACDLHVDVSADEFIPVIQKHVRDVDLTGFLCSSLWKLVNPAQSRVIHHIIEENRGKLSLLNVNDDKISQNHLHPTLQLSFVLLGIVDEIKRGGPKAKLKAKAADKMKKMKDVMKTIRKGRKKGTRDGREI